MHLAGVQRHPHAQVEPAGPRGALERPLELHRAGHRVGGAPEHRQRRVALTLRLQQPPALLVHGLRDQLVVQLERSRHRLGIGLPEARRALDVGQQEGDHPRRQIAAIADAVTDPGWSRRRREPRILREHGPLQFPQTLAGLDP